MMGKIYAGDTGTEILVDTHDPESGSEPVDITGAAITELRVQGPPPDKTEQTWAATVVDTTKLRYILQPGDIDTPGLYKIQARVTIGAWSGRGETVILPVEDSWK